MKYLIKNSTGLCDANGINIPDDNLSVYDKIKKYGFELSAITNRDVLIGSRLVSINDTTTILKFDNQNSFILINKEFDKYNNLFFDTNVKVALSNDGINWRIMLDNDSYLEKSFDINLNNLNTENMSVKDKECFLNLIENINSYAKDITKFDNDKFIRYMLIKIDSNIDSIKTDIESANGNLVRDDSLEIKYSYDKTTIRNNKSVDIKTLNIKLNQTNYIKNTLCDF